MYRFRRVMILLPLSQLRAKQKKKHQKHVSARPGWKTFRFRKVSAKNISWFSKAVIYQTFYKIMAEHFRVVQKLLRHHDITWTRQPSTSKTKTAPHEYRRLRQFTETALQCKSVLVSQLIS